MRWILMMALGLAALGCSIPKTLNPNNAKMPSLQYQEETLPTAASSDGSIWVGQSLTADFRARKVNDLVTIRIAESTNATVKGDITTSREGGNSLQATGFMSKVATYGLGDGKAVEKPVTTATNNHFKGTGSTGRSAAITTTISARVVKVLGNGNMIFEGFRDIQLNNEVQRLYIAGMLNPVFLDSTSAINSGQVAELKLGYGGRGVVDETTKPGYVSRLLNYLWPF